MRTTLTVLSLLAFNGVASSQVFQWAAVKPITLSTNPELLQHTLALDTADLPTYSRLLQVRTSYSSAYFGDQVIEKLDRNGASLRADTLLGKVHVTTLAYDSRNSLVVTGRFIDTLRIGSTLMTLPQGSSPHCFALMLDASGHLLWLRNLTADHPAWSAIAGTQVDTDGTLWLAVQANFISTYIAHLDTAGHDIGTYEQTNVRVISGLALDANRNLWVTGSTFNSPVSFNGYTTTPPHSYNMYVVRYSPIGEVHWARFVEDITLQDPQITTIGTTGIMSGNLFDSTSFGQIHAHGPHWVYDLFVTRIDAAGNFLWLSEVPTGAGQGDASIGSGPFITIGRDSSIAVAGFTRGTVNWGNGIITQSRGYKDLLCLTLSPQGIVLAGKTAGGTTSSNRADGIAIDRQGNTYCAGIVAQNAIFDSLHTTGGTTNSFIARIGTASTTSVSDISIPDGFTLLQNYPNPFNPVTNIEFRMMNAGFVHLDIYDLPGRHVATLLNTQMEQGTHTVRWDATGRASGVYLYRLSTGGFAAVRKLIVLR